MKSYKFLLLFMIIVSPALVRADGNESVSGDNSNSEDVTKASNATFDKRLPPVLPGEEIGKGKNKMKVWSTSGPVSVNPEVLQAPGAPQPWNQNGTDLGPVGVIVDQRPHDNGGHGHGQHPQH